MIVPLFVPLVLAAGPADLSVIELPDPPIQVWFDNDGRFEQGDRVRVFARALRDGYMVILHADMEGRVRVLFPLDPVQDDFVRGGQTLEILGRDDEGAFSIVQPEGYGTVLAAWSPDPFYREGLVRGDHWDYRVIAPNGVGDDPEAGLLDIVHALAGDHRFDYHTAQYIAGYPVETHASYSVGVRSSFCVGCSSPFWYDRPGFSFSLSIGGPSWSIWYHKSPWYRPLYRPVHYFDPWRFSWWVPVYRPVYWYDPWYDPWWSGRSWRHRPGVSVGIRYAGCWGDCGPRWGRPYRPGRATGVTFGDTYWRHAGGAGVGSGYAWGGAGAGTPNGGIARGAGPTRYAVPKDGSPDAGRGTGTAQPSRLGQTRTPAVAGPPPSRARNAPDNPVRGSISDDQRIRQQAQPTRAPVITSTPQNTETRRPDRNAIVRSGTQATPPSSERPGISRGIGQSNTSVREVPQARTSNGVATRPSERSAVVRGQAVQRGSGAVSSPPSTSRSTTRQGIATRPSNPDTRVVPSTRSSGAVSRSQPPQSSSGVSSRAVPSRSGSSSTRVIPSRSGSSSSRAVPSRPGSSSSRVVPSASGIGSRAAPTSRSSGSSRAIPSRTRAPAVVSPPSRSGGGAASRAGTSSGSGSSSRAAPTRSSSSRSGGVASRASSSSRGSASASRGSASGRSSGGSASARSGRGGGGG